MSFMLGIDFQKNCAWSKATRKQNFFGDGDVGGEEGVLKIIFFLALNIYLIRKKLVDFPSSLSL